MIKTIVNYVMFLRNITRQQLLQSTTVSHT